jgi:chromosome segregation ATPase
MNFAFELVQSLLATAEWERTARWALQQLEELSDRVQGVVEETKAAKAREQGAKDRQELLREALADANRAWSRAASTLRVVQADRSSLIELNRQLESENDRLQGSWLTQRTELADTRAERDQLRRQLREIRTAHEPLSKAIYPQALGKVKTLSGDTFTFGGSGVQGDGPFPGANYFTTTVGTDNQDRLHHAGYTIYKGAA